MRFFRQPGSRPRGRPPFARTSGASTATWPRVAKSSPPSCCPLRRTAFSHTVLNRVASSASVTAIFDVVLSRHPPSVAGKSACARFRPAFGQAQFGKPVGCAPFVPHCARVACRWRQFESVHFGRKSTGVRRRPGQWSSMARYSSSRLPVSEPGLLLCGWDLRPERRGSSTSAPAPPLGLRMRSG